MPTDHGINIEIERWRNVPEERRAIEIVIQTQASPPKFDLIIIRDR